MAEPEFGGLILTAKAAKDFIEEILVFQKNKKVDFSYDKNCSVGAQC
jgi:hypothetical protein